MHSGERRTVPHRDRKLSAAEAVEKTKGTPQRRAGKTSRARLQGAQKIANCNSGVRAASQFKFKHAVDGMC